MLTAREIRMRIIVDNTAPEGFCGEHGLSVWIEAGGERILFDTGKGDAFMANCSALGIDLSATTQLVLSHGHYDHTGSVAEALAFAPDAKVIHHPGAITDRWNIRAGVAKPTMMPAASKAALAALPPERVIRTGEATMIADGIGVTGSVPRLSTFEDPGGPFFLDTEGRVPDPIEDDMSLWIETSDGLVVVTGCCHSGIVNTLDHIIAFTGERRIATLLGGFHLSTASADRVDRTIDALASYDIGRIIPCHCTGQEAVEQFRQRLPLQVIPCHAGLVV
ncbi:MAG: MBL fold metallo-hydrolase [Chlorobiales bacterium]|nr:MBL fold metallo-hydrolase [Chlorobiales bacterium]